MCEPAEKVEVWAAPIVVPGPEPHLIAQQQADAPLVDARKHEQGLAVRAAHHRMAACRLGSDESEPSSPLRLSVFGVEAREPARHRMTQALVGYLGSKGRLDVIPGRLGRRDP